MSDAAPEAELALWQARLRRRLEHPEDGLGLVELLSFWRHAVVEVGCPLPRGLEPGPWLPGAIRGALGQALRRRTGLAPERESRRSAQARVLVFETLGFVTKRRQAPKPVAIQIDLAGRRLIVRLVLFGFACGWVEIFRRALIEALDGGIRLKRDGGIRARWSVAAGRWWQSERVAVPPPGLDRVRVELLTPLCLSAGRVLRTDPAEIVMAALERVSGLARFQDARLDEDWSGWRDLSKSLTFDRVDLGVDSVDHRSSRQPGNEHRIDGLVGGFDVIRPPDRLLPLLALAESAHAGARGAHGFGRLRLVAYP